jgi:predicted DNA-binding transcriptional regulator YafY
VRFVPRELPGRDAAAFVELSISRTPNRFEASVILHAAAEEIARRVPSYWGTIEPIDERTCRYRSGDDDLGWLAIRIAMLDVDFEVQEPPELTERLEALADRLGRATGSARRHNTA